MNETFQLRVHCQKTLESVFNTTQRRGKISLHCFLDNGFFVFNRLANKNASQVLSIEVDKDIFHFSIKHIPAKQNIYSAAMALQILELLDAVDNRHSAHELEIMGLALCSTALNIPDGKKPTTAIHFHQARLVYKIVQEWKRSGKRLKGSFKKFIPEGMTDRDFAETIRTLYKCQPAELLNAVNMQKLITGLLVSQDAIATISEVSGYTKKENYIAAFRNAFGVTPGHLRKQFR